MSTVRVSWSERINTVRTSSGGGSEADECKHDMNAGALEEQEQEESTNFGEGQTSTQRTDNTAVQAMDLHWLLKTANPTWTKRELDAAQDKLKKVNIVSYSELEEALKGKGILNNILREHGLKAFGSTTLDRLRKGVDAERERQRQQERLAVQRERQRLDQETRGKASMGATSAPPRDDDDDVDEGPQEADAVAEEKLGEEANDSEASVIITGEEKLGEDAEEKLGEEAVINTGDAKLDQPKRESVSLSTQSTTATTADLPLAEDHSAVEREIPCQFHPGRNSTQFRREEIVLSKGPRCNLSWEWPLTREDMKERISMLDRAVLVSYRKELDEIKAKMQRKAWHENDSSCDECDEEQEEPTFSSSSSPKTESELGIHIAG